MGLPAEVEQLLNLVESEEDRKDLRSRLEKHEKLVSELKENRASGLRQADYDRNMNRAKADLKSETDKLDKWYKDANTIYEQTLKDKQAAVEELERLKKESTQTKAAKEATEILDDALWDTDTKGLRKTLDDYQRQLDAKIEAISSKLSNFDPGRYLTQDQFSKSFTEQAQQYTRDIGGSILESIRLNDLADEHQRTYGQPLKRGEIVDFALKNNLPIEQAYEAVTKASREELHRNKIREEVIKEIESKRSYPVSGPPPEQKGPLQNKISTETGSSDWKNALNELSSEQISGMAAEQLYKSGKF